MSVMDRRDFVKSVSAAVGTVALAGLVQSQLRLTRNRKGEGSGAGGDLRSLRT